MQDFRHKNRGPHSSMQLSAADVETFARLSTARRNKLKAIDETAQSLGGAKTTIRRRVKRREIRTVKK